MARILEPTFEIQDSYAQSSCSKVVQKEHVSSESMEFIDDCSDGAYTISSNNPL